MTTAKHRANTQNFTAERNGTNDARQAGAIERGELATIEQAVRERAIELWVSGYRDEARALVAREFGMKN